MRSILIIVVIIILILASIAAFSTNKGQIYSHTPMLPPPPTPQPPTHQPPPTPQAYPQQNEDYPDYIRDIAAAINAFTDKLLDLTALYKQKDINYWIGQAAYLDTNSVFLLNNYWNENYAENNGSWSIEIIFLELSFGGNRTLYYAIDRLVCGIQGLDCNIKEMALSNVSQASPLSRILS